MAIIGTDRAFGMALESTYGTAVSPPTHWAPVRSIGLQREIDRQVVPLTGTNVGGSRVGRHFATLSDDCGGTVAFLPTYDDDWMGLLLEACFYGTPTTAGAGPYTHTFELADPTNFVALTGEVVHGRDTALDTHEIFEGLVVAGFTLEFSAREYASLSVDFIGETSGGMVSGTTPSVSFGEEVAPEHYGTLSFNGNTHVLRKFSANVQHAVDRIPALGSLYTLKPAASDMPTVTGSFELDWVDHNLYSEFLAGTQGNITMTLTGSGNNQLQVQIDNAFLRTVSRPGDGHGRSVISVEFEGLSDSSDTGLKMVLQNDNSSHK